MEIVVQQRRQRRTRRLANLAITTACVLVTLVALAYILPALFGLQRYVITGSSMTGTIDFGSVAVEKVVPVSELRVGDIITYQPPPQSGVDHLVTHRIVSIDGDVYRTKGDAVPQRDPWKFKLDDTRQPRVVFSMPYVGYPLIWLAERDTRMLVLGVPAAVIALISLGQVVSVLRPRRKSDTTQPSQPSSQPSVPVGG
jgi:signal peptidase